MTVMKSLMFNKELDQDQSTNSIQLSFSKSGAGHFV